MLQPDINSTKDKQTEMRLWKYLNSPFVLLMISSVIISLGVWFYNFQSNKTKEKSEMFNRLQKLEREIAGRLLKIKSIENECSDQDIEDIKGAFYGSNNDKSFFAYNTFEEYRNRNIYSLLTELSYLANNLTELEENNGNLKELIPDPSKDPKLWIDDSDLNHEITMIKSSEKYINILELKIPYLKKKINTNVAVNFRKLNRNDSLNFSNLFRSYTEKTESKSKVDTTFYDTTTVRSDNPRDTSKK